MNLARVIGTVVATQKYEGLTGCKLLLVQPLDHAQRKAGDYLVAVDTVRAGFGELVYFVNSREAALALEPSFVPVDAAIVGIVDEVAIDPLPAIDSDVFFHTRRPAATPAATAQTTTAHAAAPAAAAPPVPAPAATAAPVKDAATQPAAAPAQPAAAQAQPAAAPAQPAPSAPVKAAPTKKAAGKASRRRT